MIKKFYCSRCNRDLGEMNKGKIKLRTVVLCEFCNERIKILENLQRTTTSNSIDILDMFNDICRSSK